MQTIDARMRKTEVEQRKKFLTMNLQKHGVTATDDGRDLDTLRIAELEWLYIIAANKKARELEEAEDCRNSGNEEINTTLEN